MQLQMCTRHLPSAQVDNVERAQFSCISDNLGTLAAEAQLLQHP
jgi:hypothetical protein